MTKESYAKGQSLTFTIKVEDPDSPNKVTITAMTASGESLPTETISILDFEKLKNILEL